MGLVNHLNHDDKSYYIISLTNESIKMNNWTKLQSKKQRYYLLHCITLYERYDKMGKWIIKNSIE